MCRPVKSCQLCIVVFSSIHTLYDISIVLSIDASSFRTLNNIVDQSVIMKLEPVSLSFNLVWEFQSYLEVLGGRGGGSVVALLVGLCEFMQNLLTCLSGFNLLTCLSGFNNHALACLVLNTWVGIWMSFANTHCFELSALVSAHIQFS